MNPHITPTVSFPSWNTIINSNNRKDYVGFNFKHRLTTNLTLNIKVFNRSDIMPEYDDIIVFTFYFKDNAFYERKYLFTEEKYLKAIEEIKNFANEIQNLFVSFANTSTISSTDEIISNSIL